MLEEGSLATLLRRPWRRLLQVILLIVAVELTSCHLNNVDDACLHLGLRSVEGASSLKHVLEGAGLDYFRKQVSALLMVLNFIFHAADHLRVTRTRIQAAWLLALRSYLSYRYV